MTALLSEPRTIVDERAFPHLDPDEIESLRLLATAETVADGTVLFHAGDADIDFLVVEHGAIDILNPLNDNSLIVTHTDGQFMGDIDMLTRRPILVTAVARGETHLLRVPGDKLREVLNMIPRLGEKLMVAFQVRRELLQKTGAVGVRVIGPGTCRDTNVVREFLYKNFVPFVWHDSDLPDGQERLQRLGSPKKTPVIECSDGTILVNPALRELAKCLRIWRECPIDAYDLAIVGAGPAGMAAAVYAASEGLSTLVVDRLGPGGQASGSSRIENFIGFPAGLSGGDLARRGVLQMLKFGAHMVAPISVDHLEEATSRDAPHILQLDCGSRIRAHSVLVASGVCWRKLEAKGAERFERAGVYYICTTVEGMMCRGREVAVVGAGNSAGQAATYLAEQCASEVHMLIRGSDLGSSMSEYLAARVRSMPRIHLHMNTEIVEVHGTREIEGITVVNKAAGGATSRLPVSTVFVFIGAEPYAAWLPPDIARDNLGYILTGGEVVRAGRWPLTDREPCPLETSIPRILAAGDVRSGSTKRVGFAVGDGSLAVTCAHRLRSIVR